MTNLGLQLFEGRTEYPQLPSHQGTVVQGLVEVVYILVQPHAHQTMVALFERWFEAREEVEVVDYGTSDKGGMQFIVLEWFESDIDRLFLDILDAEEAIVDYCVYSREVE